MSAWKVIEPSQMPQRSVNAIESVAYRVSKGSSGKSQIKLSIGDPTFDGNLVLPEAATEAVVKCIQSGKFNGYPQAAGKLEAREAVAKYWGTRFAGTHAANCKAENIVLTCGVSEALQNVITALCDDGDNILIPAPCFPQYDFVCELYNIEARHYKCDEEKDWEIDFNHLRSLVDGKTKAILINNPSNPCGSNFSRKHVEDLIHLCEELQLPLIADEIYAGMVFSGETFTSVAEFETPVPLFILGGLSKNFMVPGWRFGWILLIDIENHAREILRGIQDVGTLTLGPSNIVQGALEEILTNSSEEYFNRNREEVRDNARAFAKGIRECHGLSCSTPQGAMYIMVNIKLALFKDIKDDVDFYEKLEDEENVQVVPGVYFHMPGYFRVVVSRPKSITNEVIGRIHDFCERHKKQ